MLVSKVRRGLEVRQSSLVHGLTEAEVIVGNLQILIESGELVQVLADSRSWPATARLVAAGLLVSSSWNQLR